jgi:hypothetical protein
MRTFLRNTLVQVSPAPELGKPGAGTSIGLFLVDPTYAGALLLASGVLTLGVGLLKTGDRLGQD